MYKVFFYNTGYTKCGFETWQDAFEHLKNACFEGGVYNGNEELILSWSPISGLTWNATHDEP